MKEVHSRSSYFFGTLIAIVLIASVHIRSMMGIGKIYSSNNNKVRNTYYAILYSNMFRCDLMRGFAMYVFQGAALPLALKLSFAMVSNC